MTNGGLPPRRSKSGDGCIIPTHGLRNSMTKGLRPRRSKSGDEFHIPTQGVPSSDGVRRPSAPGAVRGLATNRLGEKKMGREIRSSMTNGIPQIRSIGDDEVLNEETGPLLNRGPSGGAGRQAARRSGIVIDPMAAIDAVGGAVEKRHLLCELAGVGPIIVSIEKGRVFTRGGVDVGCASVDGS